MCYICRVNTGESIMSSFGMFKTIDERIKEISWLNPETKEDTTNVEEPLYVSSIDPIESPINFDALNTLTKEHYSPQARVKRMLQHAKVAAEKGSWWCNIPDVGEEEIALLKGYGLRIFKKENSFTYETQFSLNWSDKGVTPKDISLVEL